MILLGNKIIPYENIFSISCISDIEGTKANSSIIFDYNEELAKYAFLNNISSAIKIANIKEAIFANALNAKYIICENKIFAKEIQDIAENYMFDSKVLSIVLNDDEIEDIVKLGIDGVIYKDIL